jgi:hypothetical protein
MIELVSGTADTSAAARIMTTVRRWIVIEPEAIEHSRATLPMYRDWLALLDGEPVGAGSCSLNPGMEEDTAAFAVACVLPAPEARGWDSHLQAGFGARTPLGKSQLMTWGYEDDAGGVAFAELHGFVVVTRKPALRLVLDGCPPPTVELPEGIALTTLADNPELVEGVWERALEFAPSS